MSNGPDVLRRLKDAPSPEDWSQEVVACITVDDLLAVESRYGREFAEKVYAAVWETDKSPYRERLYALALMADNTEDGVACAAREYLDLGWAGLRPIPSIEWMARNLDRSAVVQVSSGYHFDMITSWDRCTLISAFYVRGEDVDLMRALLACNLMNDRLRLHVRDDAVTMGYILETIDAIDEYGDEELVVLAMLRWMPIGDHDYAMKSLVEMRDGGVPVGAAFEILTATKHKGEVDIPNLIAEWKMTRSLDLPLSLVESLFGITEGRLTVEAEL